jgi:hypothetical protein
MATISRKKTSKPDTSMAKEEVTPKKRPPASGLKEKKVAGANTRNSSTSVKTSQNQSNRDDEKSGKRGKQPEKKAEKTARAGKPKKIKLLRDSYSIPESEHKEIDALKKRCIDHGKQVKKVTCCAPVSRC